MTESITVALGLPAHLLAFILDGKALLRVAAPTAAAPEK
jgi:hypothetical protein